MLHSRFARTLLPVAVAALAANVPLSSSAQSSGLAGVDRLTIEEVARARPLTAAEYRQRRQDFAATMEDGVLVLFGEEEPTLDFVPFAQNSPFLYLTGVTEPGANLLLIKEGGSVESILFVRPRDPSQEVWDGKRLGVDGATSLTGMEVKLEDEFLPVLVAEAGRLGRVYTVEPTADLRASTLTARQQILASLKHGNPSLVVVPAPGINSLRSLKSPTELDLLQRAVSITSLAQREAMRSIQPGMNEFEILSLIEFTFRRLGAERPSFPTIVGSGPNSTTLHYRGAERWMNDGELVLMDIGASYRGYAADVTRTAPVNGHFNSLQRDVYSIVLDAQKAAEKVIGDGVTWGQLNAASNAVLEEGLTRLGLVDAPGAVYDCETAAGSGKCPQFRMYYMHALGHGVGLDVHDPGFGGPVGMEAGSAFTLEPGIYVREDALDFLPDTNANREMIARLRPALTRYANIGVRIEDTYLFTDRGVVRASSEAPREIAEIEELMAEDGVADALRLPDVLEWYRGTAPRG